MSILTVTLVAQSLLGNRSHRLLSAAQAAKMAVVYSQYTSLYVLTNVVSLSEDFFHTHYSDMWVNKQDLFFLQTAQGTCLLSYSFSMECPIALRQSFLLEAQEAFAIGLLTKAEGELVASKQELHTFLKAAYSLAITHKWLGAPPATVAAATSACLKALAQFYDYDSDAQNKDSLCAEIMHLIVQVKKLLEVKPFKNSEPGSLIPDGYRNMDDTLVNFTLEDFARAMKRFKQHHASLCEAINKCKRSGDEMDGPRLCITALGTAVDSLNTAQCPDSSTACPHQKSELCTTRGSTDELGSSWQNFSSISNGSSEKFKVVQAGIETLDTEGAEVTSDISTPLKSFSVRREALESLSQLALRTSSSSLSGSFSSSSWEKVDFSPSTATKPHSFMGMGQRKTSLDTNGSFHFLETLNSESADSAHDHMSQGQFRDLSQPQPLESHHAISVNSASLKPALDMGACAPNSPQPLTGQLASTSTESSFEMLHKDQINGNDGDSASKGDAPRRQNHLCYHCVNCITAATVDPESQYSLSLQDYQTLLAGVCHQCMLKRFHSEKKQFKLKKHRTAYSKSDVASLPMPTATLRCHCIIG